MLITFDDVIVDTFWQTGDSEVKREVENERVDGRGHVVTVQMDGSQMSGLMDLDLVVDLVVMDIKDGPGPKKAVKFSLPYKDLCIALQALHPRAKLPFGEDVDAK